MRERVTEGENGNMDSESFRMPSFSLTSLPFLKNPEHVVILLIARREGTYSFVGYLYGKYCK